MKELYQNLICTLAILTIGTFIGCEPNRTGKTSPEKAKELESVIIEKGRELYLSYGCAVCHGKEGRGDGLSAKRFYPPPIDFHDPKGYRHGNTKMDIRNTIKFGVREENSGMPAFDHITEKELDQMAEFLMSLQVKENTGGTSHEK